MYEEFFSNHPLFKSLEHYVIAIVDEMGPISESRVNKEVRTFGVRLKRDESSFPIRQSVKRILEGFEREEKIVRNTEGEYSITDLGYLEALDFVKDEIDKGRLKLNLD